MTTDIPEFKINLACRLPELTRLNEELADFAESIQLEETALYQVQLVLEELFVNFVSYGQAPTGSMTACVRSGPERMTVETRDPGIPFNPLMVAAPDTDAPLAERPIGGLGIHLLRQLGDNFSYDRKEDQNVICLEFHKMA